MADAQKMKKLIWDCQKDIAEYLPDESGISEHQLMQMLIALLGGSQAKEALGDDWKGWWRMMVTAAMAVAPPLKIAR